MLTVKVEPAWLADLTGPKGNFRRLMDVDIRNISTHTARPASPVYREIGLRRIRN